MSAFSSHSVQKIASLAQIPVSEKEAEKLATGFDTTIAVVDHMSEVQTHEIEYIGPSERTNVWREDVIDATRMFSQEQALSNAKNTHNGYIVVPQIIEQD